MRTQTFEFSTGRKPVIHDITGTCESFVAEHAGGGGGLLNVFVPHATAGVALLELGAGSDEDLLRVLDELLPGDDRWRHRHGSRGHGRSHVMPAFLPPQTTIPVVRGSLELGTWQSVALVDLNVDNPDRTVRLTYLGDE